MVLIKKKENNLCLGNYILKYKNQVENSLLVANRIAMKVS